MKLTRQIARSMAVACLLTAGEPQCVPLLHAAARDYAPRKTIRVQTLVTGLGGLSSSREMLLQGYTEVALLREGGFQLATDAELNITLQVVGFIPPAPHQVKRDSKGRKVIASVAAGGLISVLAVVTDRDGRELKSYLVTEPLYPVRAPADTDNALQRVSRQLGSYIKNAFGRN